MPYEICYWDEVAREQKVRQSTPEEDAQRDADISAANTPTILQYTATVQAMLDTEAHAHNYDDIVSACSYAAAPNPFQAEGISFVTWRGACWAKCYEIMAEVQAGQRAQPSIAELLAMMPVRV